MQALEMELAGYDGALAPWPSKTRASHIADAIGKSEKAVRKWRETSWYRAALEFLRAKQIAKQICNKLEKQTRVAIDDRKRLIANQLNPQRRDMNEYLIGYLGDQWRGPIKSMIDGKIYNSPEEYARHVKESGCTWLGPRNFDPDKFIRELREIRRRFLPDTLASIRRS